MDETTRAEKIQHLKDLFRLSFRVNTTYEATLDDSEAQKYFYDEQVDFAPDEPAGFGDDSEMEEFRADFQALDAEVVFIELCTEYYQDELAELQTKLAQQQQRLATLPRKKSHEKKVVADLEERIALNRQRQSEIQQKLTKLRAQTVVTVSERER